jgi:hypothetical protein
MIWKFGDLEISDLEKNAEDKFNDDVEDMMFGFVQKYRSFSFGEGEGG